MAIARADAPSNVPQRISGITAAGTYCVENLYDGRARIAVVAGNSAPTDTQTYFELAGHDHLDITLKASETAWLWGPRAGQSARVSFNQV